MSRKPFVPNDEMEAARWLKQGVDHDPVGSSPDLFLRAWSAIAYLHPGLHPDHYFDEDGGWEGKLRDFATEAWARFEDGRITDDQLYPSDAQWCGLYDQMQFHSEESAYRRESLRVA